MSPTSEEGPHQACGSGWRKGQSAAQNCERLQLRRKAGRIHTQVRLDIARLSTEKRRTTFCSKVLISPDCVFDASLVPGTCLRRFVDFKGFIQQVPGEFSKGRSQEK